MAIFLTIKIILMGKVLGGGIKTQEYTPSSEKAKEWDGWGTALKPCIEPITMARKPLSEKTVVENVLKYNTGGINIDGSRVSYSPDDHVMKYEGYQNGQYKSEYENGSSYTHGTQVSINKKGRWPSNLIHDGSDNVEKCFPDRKGWSGQNHSNFNPYGGNSLNDSETTREGFHEGFGDSGSSSRFFLKAEFGELDFLPLLYYAKASKKDRGKGNNHPTVKPVELMKTLVKLVTPKGGICLDPYLGSFTTAVACKELGFDWVGAELSEEEGGHFTMGLDRYNGRTRLPIEEFI